MQFIAEDPVHVNVRSEIPAIYDGKGRLVQPKQKRLFAEFRRGEAPAWTWPIAREYFAKDGPDGYPRFRTLPADVPFERWLCSYESLEDQDRRGWSDEERELIEEKLKEQGYISVERPRVEVPYRKYLEHRYMQGRRTIEFVINDIKEAIEATGIDPSAVVAYEHDHFDEHSPAIIEAMGQIGVESVQDEEIVVA